MWLVNTQEYTFVGEGIGKDWGAVELGLPVRRIPEGMGAWLTQSRGFHCREGDYSTYLIRKIFGSQKYLVILLEKCWGNLDCFVTNHQRK